MDLTKLREAIGAAKEIPDTQVLELATAKLGEGVKALELSRSEKTTVEKTLADLTTRLANADAKVLELSRAPDPVILEDRASVKADRIDLALERGQCVKAQADILKAAIREGDKPNALMLARAGTFGTPIDLALKVLELNKPFTGTVTGFQQLPDPNANGADPMKAGRDEAAAWQASQQQQRGLVNAA